MSRTKPAEERRADLLAAGRSLFITKGIAATTLEEITTGAGVSKGLFYQYFGSKDDLVAALQEQFSSQFAQRMRDAIDAQPDWAAKLDATVQAAFECYRELHELHEVLFHHGGHEHGPGRPGQAQPGRPQAVTSPGGAEPARPGGRHAGQHRGPAHTPHAQVMRELLDAGVAAGTYRVDDTETTAVLFYMTMHALDLHFHGGQPPTETQLVRATQQMFRRAAGIAG
ncbi:MAG TPA: TetR/AcrR family transcriptional regulator [Streptosporangiaceae bacterium]|jgi:AcrR family transcriptional regulator|nr:TetR/AcrR family transcriptional regulator [Streptosporangiaceae bacterium]